MENTLENKAKFFAQYWGQDGVCKNENGTYYPVEFILGTNAIDRHFLELTPLHLITDEDAIEVCKIRWQELKKEHPYVKGDACEGFRICNEIKHTSVNAFIVLQIFDYLRSKGYALPYNGLSVSEQVERGWVVLKTKI